MKQNNVTLKQLRAFTAVERFGKYRHAAREIGISQSVLSASVKQLEKILGIEVFWRSTRKVELSPQGREILPIVHRILNDIDTLLQDRHRQEDRKTVRVSVACLPAIATRFIPEIIARFAQLEPHSWVDVHDDVPRDIIGHVQRSEVDFGVGCLIEIDPRLKFTPILKDRYCAIADRRIQLPAGKAIKWSELNQFPILAPAPGTHLRELINPILDAGKRSLRIVYQAHHVHTLLGVVRQGVGVALLPRLSLPPGNSDDLRCVPLTRPVIERQIGLITLQGRQLSPAAQTLFDIFGQYLRQARTDL